jgi:hypothetical protein
MLRIQWPLCARLRTIRPDESQGEPPLIPLLRRYAPTGGTDGVDFKTTRPVFMTQFSHVNAVAADTQTWEQSAAFRLEQAMLHGLADCYVRKEKTGVNKSIQKFRFFRPGDRPPPIFEIRSGFHGRRIDTPFNARLGDGSQRSARSIAGGAL